MITVEQSKALRKAGLGHVCILNGELRDSKDFSKLSPSDLARAQQIVTGAKTGHTKAVPSTKPAPVKKR